MRNPILRLSAALCAPMLAAQVLVVEGDYIEDRSNHVHGCYCEWSGESIYSGTEVTLAWQFRRGSHEGIALAGVRIAAVLRSESTLSIGDPPRRSVLVLDQTASPAQRRATELWLTAHFGPLLGQVIDRLARDIEFSRTSEHALVRIPGLLNVEMRKSQLPGDALPGAIRWFEPFIPLDTYELGTTLNTAYQGREFNYRWNISDPGARGYFGTFQLAEPPPAPRPPT